MGRRISCFSALKPASCTKRIGHGGGGTGGQPGTHGDGVKLDDGLAIPGGLAGIRERMAAMGHTVMEPVTMPDVPEDDGDEGSRNKPEQVPGHSRNNCGGGFSLSADMCTENGQFIEHKPLFRGAACPDKENVAPRGSSNVVVHGQRRDGLQTAAISAAAQAAHPRADTEEHLDQVARTVSPDVPSECFFEADGEGSTEAERLLNAFAVLGRAPAIIDGKTASSTGAETTGPDPPAVPTIVPEGLRHGPCADDSKAMDSDDSFCRNSGSSERYPALQPQRQPSLPQQQKSTNPRKPLKPKPGIGSSVPGNAVSAGAIAAPASVEAPALADGATGACESQRQAAMRLLISTQGISPSEIRADEHKKIIEAKDEAAHKQVALVGTEDLTFNVGLNLSMDSQQQELPPEATRSGPLPPPPNPSATALQGKHGWKESALDLDSPPEPSAFDAAHPTMTQNGPAGICAVLDGRSGLSALPQAAHEATQTLPAVTPRGFRPEGSPRKIHKPEILQQKPGSPGRSPMVMAHSAPSLTHAIDRQPQADATTMPVRPLEQLPQAARVLKAPVVSGYHALAAPQRPETQGETQPVQGMQWRPQSSSLEDTVVDLTRQLTKMQLGVLVLGNSGIDPNQGQIPSLHLPQAEAVRSESTVAVAPVPSNAHLCSAPSEGWGARLVSSAHEQDAAVTFAARNQAAGRAPRVPQVSAEKRSPEMRQRPVSRDPEPRLLPLGSPQKHLGSSAVHDGVSLVARFPASSETRPRDLHCSAASTARQHAQHQPYVMGRDLGKDLMVENITAFRAMFPSGTFNDWLAQLSPQDITRAIMSSQRGTGIWRELWDSVPQSGQMNVRSKESIETDAYTDVFVLEKPNTPK